LVDAEDYAPFVDLLYGDQQENGGIVQARISGIQHPLYARAGTPDAVEIVHSVVREAYGKYLPNGEVRFVVDAGAYIGDATSWYLSKFPQSRVVALEPTPDSYAMLQRNCAPYGDRVRMINGALWFQDDFLDLVQNPSTSTGISVAKDAAGGGRVHAFSLNTIMDEAGADVIDILKLDIEGAELQLFQNDPDPWLSRTRCITMEIHSEEASKAVHSAVQRFGFVRHRYRELFIFIQPARRR